MTKLLLDLREETFNLIVFAHIALSNQGIIELVRDAPHHAPDGLPLDRQRNPGAPIIEHLRNRPAYGIFVQDACHQCGFPSEIKKIPNIFLLIRHFSSVRPVLSSRCLGFTQISFGTDM